MKSAGKTLYEGTDPKGNFVMSNLVDFSDDISRSVAKNQFWYVDSDATSAI